MIEELQSKIEKRRDEYLPIREAERKEAESFRNEMHRMLAAVLLKSNE